LRSIGEFDVSHLARQFGGGGHKHAAGFQVPLEEANLTSR
jgi:nanoRNase/pAp phosphatase (c-di-AMP/oligoRNAs hydrolase)